MTLADLIANAGINASVVTPFGEVPVYDSRGTSSGPSWLGQLFGMVVRDGSGKTVAQYGAATGNQAVAITVVVVLALIAALALRGALSLF